MKRTPNKWVDYSDWTIEQHREYLRTEPNYLNYFAQFDPESVERFINDYGKSKYYKYEREEYYKSRYEAYQTHFLSHAERYLEQILQKKLFNLQCLWRADQIELPLVDISDDFVYWSNNIRACPFIPPITEEEIDLCIRFLKEDIDWGHCNNPYAEDIWQDYEEFKNQLFIDENQGTPEAEELRFYATEMPQLYLFFDTYQGTTHLLRLPDIRGKKERVYKDEGRNIAYEERVAVLKAENKIKVDENGNIVHKTTALPILYSSDEAKFIEAAEDERTKDLFKAYEHDRQSNHDLNYEGLEDDLETLKEFDEPIPIEAYSDWRFAVRMATYRFRQKKAAEMLPYVYDSYLLEFDDETDTDKIIAQRVARVQFSDKYGIYKHLLYKKNEFLNGREALTGKRDFDYMND